MGGGPGRGNRWWDLLLLCSSAQIVRQVEEDWVNDRIIDNDNWGRVERNGSDSYILVVWYRWDGEAKWSFRFWAKRTLISLAYTLL
jgi:hypothetical protein